MEVRNCSQQAEKLLFNRVWEGKDRRPGQVWLRGVIPPDPPLKHALIPFFEGSCLRLAESGITSDLPRCNGIEGLVYTREGAREADAHTREYPHIYNFFKFSGRQVNYKNSI